MHKLQPIAVIASFDAKGNIAPLWLRIAEYKLKVESYVLKECKMERYDFFCNVIDNNTRKEVEILFCAREGMWYYLEK